MTMSKADYEQFLESAGGTTVLCYSDSVAALEFAFDLLCEEAAALKREEPYAFKRVSEMEAAAREVYNLMWDVDNEEFSDSGEDGEDDDEEEEEEEG